MKFTKMHGAGNDYIYIDGFVEKVPDPTALAIEMSDRHFGVGSDGLIMILPSEQGDVRMRMFNADGSEAQMCGNGIRCVAKYAYDHGLAKKTELTIETAAGLLTLKLFPDENDRIEQVRVNMGRPRLRRGSLPMIGPETENAMNINLEAANRQFRATCLSMGNPHCVIYVDEINCFPVREIGPVIENHSWFPERVNVIFVEVLNKHEIRQRTWERGAGETLACGTGASAACVAGVLTGRTERRVQAHLPGGDLQLEWAEDDHVYLTGPAVEIFTGEWPT